MRSDPHPASSDAVLVVDAGSTTTKVALADGRRLARLGAFPTGLPAADGWEDRFEALLDGRGQRAGPVGSVAIASVTPTVVDRLRRVWAARTGAGGPICVVDPARAPLEVDYRPPSSLGADRVANAVAATDRWGAPVIVVDVGAALTCDLVSADRRFVGGAIAPGPDTAYRGLLERAPHLARAGGLTLTNKAPEAAARSTGEALHVGVVRSTAALIDSLVADHHSQVGPCPVVITGGLGPLIAQQCATATTLDPDLTLHGIHLTCTLTDHRLSR